MLAALHGKRIALLVGRGDRRHVVFGVGGYCTPPGEPACLVIRLEQYDGCSDRVHLVLCEEQWDGQIESGDEYGCDYCIRLDAMAGQKSIGSGGPFCG